MAGGVLAGADKQIASVVEEKEVVLVGPTTLYPEDGFQSSRHIFYLFSGLKEESRALVNFVTERLQKQNPRLAIVYADREISKAMVEAIEQQSKKFGYNSLSKYSYKGSRADWAQISSRLNDADVDGVFFLGAGEEAAAFLRAAEKMARAPYLLIPGSLASRDLLDSPMVFKDRLFMSFPTLPSDQTSEAVMEFRMLAEKHKLPTRHLAAQLSAVCAAKILVEGLKLAGKELSREKLINALEGFYNFETGLTPPVTYGPNRRIGALGAYIVGLDLEKKQFIPASGWIIPD